MQISGFMSGCLSVPKTLVFQMRFSGSIGEPNTSVEFLPFLQLYFQSGFTSMFLLQSEAVKLNADCITGQIIFFGLLCLPVGFPNFCFEVQLFLYRRGCQLQFRLIII